LPHKKLQKIASALSRCDRVLVHTHADLNRLKQVGVTNNATLLPHGIVHSRVPTKRVHRSPKEFVLASYGFFLPNKGLLELIEAFAILREQGRDCRLIMVNAQYPIDLSSELIALATERITALGLWDHITLITAFLEDEQSLDMLVEADLVVFPYQETGESASGAVRFGIASGRPVAVTPLPIFSDVQAVVHRLPGFSPPDLARGIAQLADERQHLEQLTTQQQASTEQWLQEHQYPKVSQRLEMMLAALYADRCREL